MDLVTTEETSPLRLVAVDMDGGNDVEMLRLAGLGVAMADAPETIKVHADVVAASSDEHGVLAFLEGLVDAPVPGR